MNLGRTNPYYIKIFAKEKIRIIFSELFKLLKKYQAYFVQKIAKNFFITINGKQDIRLLLEYILKIK
jgi:hypothetical protein